MADSSLPGNKAASDDHRQALPAGTRFGELEILRTLGIGGFGIVYLARDHALERDVAIKEFMPAHLAWRSLDARVSVRASSSYKTFEAGRRSFVNEARLLARFDHRSLLKVYRFWEDNGTAYMAMPYLQGQTLTKARKDMGHAPDEAWIRQRLMPLLDALALLHSEGVYHRDIAPDNIWLSATDGVPVLLDFGAARREMGDQTQGFTAILKPSYAPIEQYAESSALRQGPWTDLYALGAVLYHLLTGEAPPPATARIVADECQPLSERDTPSLRAYSPSLLHAIDWAMAVRPKDRPGDVAEFRAVLMGDAQAPSRAPWVAPPPERLHPLMNLAPRADPDATTVRQQRTAGQTTTESVERSTMPDVESTDVGGALPDQRLAMTLAAAEPMTPQAQAAVSAVRLPASGAALAASSRRVPQRLWIAGGAVLVGAGLLTALAQVLGGKGVEPPAPPSTLTAAASAPADGASVVPLSPLEAASAVLSASAPPVLPRMGTAPNATTHSMPLGVKPAGQAKSAEPTTSSKAQPKVQPAQVAPVQAAASSLAPAPASEAGASPAGQEDPTAACADRANFLARDFCVARRCERPQFEKHPVCVRLQEIREQRRERRN